MTCGTSVISAIALAVIVVLTGSGCVSKRYVSQQISPVNQRLDQFEKQTSDRIAWINNKEQNDIARVSDQITSTNGRVSHLADDVLDAQGTASRAVETADANRTAAGNPGANYQLVESASVTFGFGQATLTADAKRTLDRIVNEWRGDRLAMIELAGSTDRAGSANYNLALSRRRAWTVQKYLVEHGIPTRAISTVGLGKDVPSAGVDQGLPTAAHADRAEETLARRVSIHVFRPEVASASRSEE